MKKKVIASILVSSMLLIPFPVLANEKDNYLHRLSFDKIKTEMEARSPLISAMWDRLPDSSDLDTTKMKKDISDMQTNLGDAKLAYQTFNTAAENADDKDPQKAYYTMMASSYGAIVANLSATMGFLQMNLGTIEAQKDNLWKSYIQVEQGKNQAIQGVQQLFLAYFTAEQSRDELKSNLDLLENKVKVAKLQESLGMTTAISTLESEAQIKELKNTLESLNKSLANLKGNLNLMLGQDYDTELTLVEPSDVTRSMIREMDYDEDLKDALIQSYDVRLAEESDDIRQAKKEFTFAFHQAYQNVLDKQKALILAQEKLSLEEKKYDHNYLMYSLGLIARLDFDGLRTLYRTQVNAVESAERALLQAYTDYQWMKKGLKVSPSAGGSGASAASSGAGGMQSSGMGF